MKLIKRNNLISGLILVLLLSALQDIHASIHSSYSKLTATMNIPGSHHNNAVHSTIPKPPPMNLNVKKNYAAPSGSKLTSEYSKKKSETDNHNKIHSLPTLNEINNHNNQKKSQDLPTLNQINSQNPNNLTPPHAENNAKIPAHSQDHRIQDNRIQGKEPKTVTKWKPTSLSTASKSQSSGGFFQNTSKQNRNAAWKALGMFVLGFILFIVSIQVTCWNERRAVKFSNFIDWVEDKNNCEEIGFNPIPKTEKPKNKAYIIHGNLQITKEAESEHFKSIIDKIKINSPEEKVLCFKLESNKWEKISETETDQVRVDEAGNEERATVNTYDWRTIEPQSKNEFFSSEIILGEANLDDIYEIDIHKLERMVSKQDYTPTKDDQSVFEEYIKSKLGLQAKSSEKIFLVGNAIYYIPELAGEEFNPVTYTQFTEFDRKMNIKYYSAKKNQKQFTLAGKLEEKSNKFQVTPFNSPIKDASYSFYLCCCGESDTTYSVDVFCENVKTKKEIIEDYQTLNKACTLCWRVIGFLMHFFAYYCILYPIIMLVGMIPFIGAVGATILIIFAFLFSLITFLFIIACAWIFARPLLALLIFAVIGALMFLSKTTNDKFGNGKSFSNNSDNMNYNSYNKKFL